MSDTVRALLRSAGNYPIFQDWDKKGGMFIVKNKAARNAIPAQFRVLDTDRTTMCYVEGDEIYYLNNNPAGDLTADTDWEIAVTKGVPETLIGTWKSDNTDPVLLDTDSTTDNNGDYYFVRGAPTDQMVTHTGLFEGNTETVKNGDMIVSAAGKWVVRRFDPQVNIPEELIVRQYVQDITERDNLDRWEGMAVVVKDIGTGFSAEYLYKPSSVDADGQGFVLLTNPNLNPSGQVVITSDNALAITGPGIYVYVGAGDANWTIPSIGSAIQGGIIMCKNRSSDEGNLIINADAAGEIYDTDGTYDTKLIFPEDKFVSFIAETYWTI